MKKVIKKLYPIALVVLIIAGLDWLFYLFGYELVELVFGAVPVVAQIVYALFGLSAVLVAAGKLMKLKK